MSECWNVARNWGIKATLTSQLMPLNDENHDNYMAVFAFAAVGNLW